MGGVPAAVDVAAVALDDYTLQLTLKAPCTYFTSLLTVGPFYPSKAGLATLEDPSWWKNPETSLGNGAYYLTEYVDGDHYFLAKNPNYWNADAVNIDRVNVYLVYDQQALLAAYQTGEVDVATGLPDYIGDAYQGSDELFIWNMLTSKFILPNLNVTPLDDVRVREAIALGLNREEICAVIGADYIPSTSYVAEFMMSNASSAYFSKEREPLFTEDVAKAQDLLADAGYPGGEGFPTLTYTYPNSDKDALLAQAIQAQLKQNLGISIELNGVEDQVYSSTRSEGSYDLIRHSWTADFNDPINYLDLYTSYSGGNYNGVNSPEYDALIEGVFALGSYALEQGMESELIYFNKHSDHSRSVFHPQEDLRTLMSDLPGLVEKREDYPVEQLLERASQDLYIKNNVALVTASVKPETVQLLMRVRLQGRQPIVFFIMPGGLPQENRDERLAALKPLNSADIPWFAYSDPKELEGRSL